jgi:hypothetical protein
MKPLKHLIFIFIISYSKAQNLVPNSSFEMYDTCPNNIDQILYLQNWYSPTTGKADFYTQCGTNQAGVPYNYWGFQFARTGVSYTMIAGYEVQANPNNTYREYLQVELKYPLIVGRSYCVSFYASLADDINNFGYSLVAITELGLYFSNNSINSSNSFPLNSVQPHINSASGFFLSDTINWMEISGEYNAIGGEKFITIGNFKNNFDTDTIIISNNLAPGAKAFYYIDDVSVIDCDSVGIGVDEIQSTYTSFNLYPNPNNGLFTLEYHLLENESGVISIYDLVGKLIATYPINNAGVIKTIDANQLNAGTYFYEIKVNDKRVKMDKLIIVE